MLPNIFCQFFCLFFCVKTTAATVVGPRLMPDVNTTQNACIKVCCIFILETYSDKVLCVKLGQISRLPPSLITMQVLQVTPVSLTSTIRFTRTYLITRWYSNWFDCLVKCYIYFRRTREGEETNTHAIRDCFCKHWKIFQQIKQSDLNNHFTLQRTPKCSQSQRVQQIPNRRKLPFQCYCIIIGHSQMCNTKPSK